MSDPHALPDSPELQALHARLAEHSLAGHWQSREKNPELVPYLWTWSMIYSCLMESGEVVKLGGIDDAAKRRIEHRRFVGLLRKAIGQRQVSDGGEIGDGPGWTDGGRHRGRQQQDRQKEQGNRRQTTHRRVPRDSLNWARAARAWY